MQIPENLRDIVDRLSTAMVQALARDEATRALARQIQAQGFELALVLEATVALQPREDPEDQEPQDEGEFTMGAHKTQWSEEDKAFLRTFRISM